MEQPSPVPPAVLSAFGLDPDGVEFSHLAGGLINKTVLARQSGGQKAVLQQINTLVFQNPAAIAHNIARASTHLGSTSSIFPASQMLEIEGEWWRISDFISDALTLQTAETEAQAEIAAAQFARLVRLLHDCPVEDFQATIPGFHNLDKHVKVFEAACRDASPERIHQARDIVSSLTGEVGVAVLTTYRNSLATCPIRICHHDAKISNVLLSGDGRGGHVCDLDTLMPGRLISDIGDLIRTLVPPVSEEEVDFAKVIVRKGFFRSVIRGYVKELGPLLLPSELQVLEFGGRFMAYMQAVRFVTDYLRDDVYYATSHERPLHNLERAANQLALLVALHSDRLELCRIVEEVVAECC